MENQEQILLQLVESLIKCWENEVVEFKEATNDFSTSEIGKYFSALANEANLRGIEQAWLVFGVNNKIRRIVGTNYREDSERLQSLKMQLAQGTEPRVTFRNIFECLHPQGRVVLFEIPPAPPGIPIAWNGHYYARAGESLTALGLDKLDAIRKQTSTRDWSAQVIREATIAHLEEQALHHARESFKQKYANRFPEEEINQWPISTFLERARLTRDGRLTRAALLLLGKPESAHLLNPHPAQITWKLEGPERAYAHFGPPFLLTTTHLYQKIRNIQIRILPEDAFLAVEMAKYDQKVVLEALHNCIVHQDYTRNGRIVVTEYPDKLIFENEGSFYDGHPDDYLSGTKTPRRYRNPFLAQAMSELNMIDIMGYGIYQIHLSQAKRYFPMPDYDLENPEVVRMTIYGSIVDQNYTRLLMQRTNLPLKDIVALDRVQKRLPVDNTTLQRLRRAGLVEGRKPNIHVSAVVAQTTERKVEYIRTRSQDDFFYEKLVIDYLKEFGQASRREINELLWDKLSDALDFDQKTNKINNLLTKLRRAGKIENEGSRKAPRWRLAE
ncbi:MAG: ATP-binding protein [Bacteroidetes bacterium]|nr:MAG: ATP-binding protein [Bacteroidota bacterium]